MKFIHRVAVHASPARQQTLETLGVKPVKSIVLPGNEDPLLAFDIDEAHPNWSSLRALFQDWDASDVVRTEFSRHEIDDARWLDIAAWHHGYPQPDEDDFGYRRATYDSTDSCAKCGIGKKQKAPFQMMGEPQWGRRGVLQLIWVYEELFVTPEVWKTVFEPCSVACRAVHNTKGIALATVVQLVIESEVAIASSGLPHEQCATCGRLKYLPIVRGPFPALLERPSTSIARTREYFGSGGQADRAVLVSQNIAHRLAAHKVRGHTLRPVCEDDPAPPH